MFSHWQKKLYARVNHLPAIEPTASFISPSFFFQIKVVLPLPNSEKGTARASSGCTLASVKAPTDWNAKKTNRVWLHLPSLINLFLFWPSQWLSGTEPSSLPSTHSSFCVQPSPPASLTAVTAKEQVHEKVASRRWSVKRAGRGSRLPGESLRGVCAPAAGCHAGGSDRGPGANKVGHYLQL